MRLRAYCLLSGVFILVFTAFADDVPAKIGKYPQEIATHFSKDDGLPANDVRAVTLGEDGTVWATTAKGLAVYKDGAWQETPAQKGENGAVQRARAFLAKMGGNAGLSEEMAKQLERYDNCTGLAIRRGGFAVATNDGLFLVTEGQEPKPLLEDCAVAQLVLNREERITAATDKGLFAEREDGSFKSVNIEDGLGRRWAVSEVRGAVFDHQGRLWCAMPAGVACRDGDQWRFFTGKEGLPYNDFTCMAAGGDGSVWLGTRKGAIRFDGEHWAYRQGRCWLPDDHVRDIAVDSAGNAWFATAKGVGFIERRPMTLAEKAQFYEQEIEKYIKRTPFGYVAQVNLKHSGDKSEVIRSDDDNDGLWTSMYGAGECFAYGATKDPAAKTRAQQAFEALRFLQTVTQGGKHSPPKGYVARSIRSTDDPDPNIGRIEGDRRHKAENDALWKIYEPRWPKSADGKWYWKSDTSSDELDGHYFFYPAYYDLVAETEDEKQQVREVVRDLTDHLMDAGFYLIDFDGTPTRWAIYGPKSLNNDPDWWPERGLKSLSIMSYLAAAEHVTGDPKYGAAIRELVEKHGYQANAMIYKLHFGPGSGNQSDDEMAFMCYYNLMKYAQDETLRKMILASFYMAWTVEQPELNPFFNFAYAAFGLGITGRDTWGEYALSPWDGWLDDSMATLEGFPLDRLNWAHTNSHRLDLIHLPRQQASDPFSEPDRSRGYRNNGKVLPVEERFFNHWNTDPWELDYGGDGRGLASGTVFLLPYYMGLYHKFIEETD